MKYRTQVLPKRYQRMKWDAQEWSVHVVDGNGIEWLATFPEGKVILEVIHPDTTPEIARSIIRVMNSALEFTDLKRFASNNGVVIPFKPRTPK